MVVESGVGGGDGGEWWQVVDDDMVKYKRLTDAVSSNQLEPCIAYAFIIS